MKRFDVIDHPSDVGILAYGGTRQELFENAAYGMFSLMADIEKVVPREKLKITVKADEPEALLINWLNELVYTEDSRKMLFCEFKIEELTDTGLTAEIGGEKIDLKVHSLHRPIKAATYSQLKVSGDRARIVFDV